MQTMLFRKRANRNQHRPAGRELLFGLVPGEVFKETAAHS
jgi:hypothetical protein